MSPEVVAVLTQRMWQPEAVTAPHTLRLRAGLIAAIEAGWTEHGSTTLDARDGWVIPGLIDLQVNGGLGWSFQSADQDHFQEITHTALAHGTTTLLPTLVTAPPDILCDSLKALAQFSRSNTTGAALGGIHLEGPFLSPLKSGAHDPAALRLPDLELMERLIEAAAGTLKMVTLAPELQGALPLIRNLSQREIVVSAGHSAAGYAQLRAAVSAGLRFMTHLGNASDWPGRAMDERGFMGSEPGMVGAFMALPEIGGSIIADGFHFHPALIAPLACLKPDQLVFVSDAAPFTGLPAGMVESGGLRAEIHPQGFATSARGGGWLAGSLICLLQAVRVAVEDGACSMQQAVTLATRNPARLLGLMGKKGEIRVGGDADLLVLNPDFTLRHVIQAGRLISTQA